jgi:hypothetical protein
MDGPVRGIPVQFALTILYAWTFSGYRAAQRRSPAALYSDAHG